MSGTNDDTSAAETVSVKGSIVVKELSKTFGGGERQTKALDKVSLHVAPQEMCALIGPSGSGKSTLLRHLSGLVEADRDACCRVDVSGEPIQTAKGLGRGLRNTRRKIGFIFQQFNLVGRLSLLTNVCIGQIGDMPIWRSLLSWFTQEEKLRAMAALKKVGMDRYAGQRASTLSGGQQQRGAIARALVQGSEVVLADEPIASLDPASSTLVMNALKTINESGLTVVVCLHQVDIAIKYCPRVIALRDGVIVYDGSGDGLTKEFLADIYGAEAFDAGLETDEETANADTAAEPQSDAIAKTNTLAEAAQ